MVQEAPAASVPELLGQVLLLMEITAVGATQPDAC